MVRTALVLETKTLFTSAPQHGDIGVLEQFREVDHEIVARNDRESLDDIRVHPGRIDDQDQEGEDAKR